MPRTPRPDPWWFVVPTLAILIALGWPSRLPVNPRADPRATVLSGRPALAEAPGAEVAPPPRPGPPRGAVAVVDPIRQALAPLAHPAVPNAMPATMPVATATPGGSITHLTPDPLPEPSATRPGASRRPALPPPVATRPGGGATSPAAPPPGTGHPLGVTASPTVGIPAPAASGSATAAGGSRPRLGWPLPGPVAVSRAFERPATPFGPGHRGVDLPAPPGGPVIAAADGTVSFAGPVAGRGVVTVTHGELRTTYEPVLPTAQVGAVLRAGEPLGTLLAGHGGCPAPACLHWGLLRGSEYLDPLGMFRRVPPRLLPLGGVNAR